MRAIRSIPVLVGLVALASAGAAAPPGEALWSFDTKG